MSTTPLERAEDPLNDGMVRNERLRFALAWPQFLLAVSVFGHCGRAETP